MWVAVLGLGAGLGALGGCTTLGFYQQAIVGQVRLLNARKDVTKLLTSEDLSPELRSALEDSQAVLQFAENQLGLAADGRYQDYVALDRPFVVWNLVVAPVDSVTPRTWCFPVAGCVSYRGYFSRERAEANAGKFDPARFDTFVGGVPAYSTLGWFDDPLLSSFIFWTQPARAELLFHELAHGRLYVPGDTAFNESFATFVADYALPLYLAENGPNERDLKSDPLEVHRLQKKERARFNALLLLLRERIAADFADIPVTLADADRRAAALDIRNQRYAAAAGCLIRVKEQFTDPKRLLAILEGPPNLARLSLVGAYNGWLNAFSTLFADVGQDIERFYTEVEVLAELDFDERQTALARLNQRFVDSQQQVKPQRDNDYPKDIKCEALADHSSDGDVAG